MNLIRQDLARKNFKWKEFFKSETADKLKIKNLTNDQEILANLMVVADKIQEIRDTLKQPILISSGYRCLQVNKAVGSKDNSQHLKGQAVDFICPNFGTPEEIVRFLKKSNIEVDQALVEKSWVHLSIKPNSEKYSKNRNQFAFYINDVFTLIS